jgi:hypothetical protein
MAQKIGPREEELRRMREERFSQVQRKQGPFRALKDAIASIPTKKVRRKKRA